ncbi:hypothetical protein K505DRAFT_363961 [Melanomma pulvis-pyrius CBS 109.77]|uniref:Uncharacterized protein n=1 Tax=Melanomma pulvis-pyrius CBS 109.77 TaxID=1314802 RepID=A0A6A6X4J3_9PLEO|nr:hypothetical protein K505DRAFT_363961 [Melanomma pulvis-pyrius CBS 109.77]
MKRIYCSTSNSRASDGPFKLLYEQTAPVKFKNGQGSFAGWWYDLQAENVFPYQSQMRWSLFACQTGHPIDFAAYATARLEEIIKALEAQGLYKGDTLGPLSFHSVCDDSVSPTHEEGS